MNKSMLNEKILRLGSAALTDCGQRRALNEDGVFHHSAQTQTGEPVGLYLVCDGLGGLQAGDVASRLALDTVTAELFGMISTLEGAADEEEIHPRLQALRQSIRQVIEEANTKIRYYAKAHQDVTHIGTTITLAAVYNRWLQIANVGDSRVYLWRDGHMIQLTEDHSMAAQLARWDKIDEAEIVNHPKRNVLYRTLGMYDNPDLEIDMFQHKLEAGDKLLLCSDGLWQAFPKAAELGQWLDSSEPIEELCQQLVTEANRRDGSDNISAVVVSLDEMPGWKSQQVLAAGWRNILPVGIDTE